MTTKIYRFSIKVNSFVFIIFQLKCDMRENRVLYLFKRFDFSFFQNILSPGDFSKAKLYKIGSRIPITVLPFTKSHFK